MLAAWLSLHSGVSRDTANLILRAVGLVITTTLQLVQTSLQQAGYDIILPEIQLPTDIRTTYGNLNVEPEIIRTVCCPNCFSLYESPIPDICVFRKSPRSRPCNTPLWKQRQTRNGPRLTPVTHYNTQSFTSWLRFFLNRPGVEEHLEHTWQRTQAGTVKNLMTDVQDSPAWQKLRHFLLSPYHLIFAIYVDWFNPLSNRMAGEWNKLLLN